MAVTVKLDRNRMGDILRDIAYPQLKTRLDTAVQRAKNAVPPGQTKRSYRGRPVIDTPLHDTITHTDPVITPDRVYVEVVATAHNAEVIEFGRPAVSVSRARPPMKWFGPGGGRIVAFQVKGVKERRYLRNAMKSVFSGSFKEGRSVFRS